MNTAIPVCPTPTSRCPHPGPYPNSTLDQVRRIPKVLQRQEILLNTPRTDEPIENRDTPRLIVRPARTRTTERLLSDDGTRALFVVVDVASCVAKLVGGEEKGFALGCEAGNLRMGEG